MKVAIIFSALLLAVLLAGCSHSSETTFNNNGDGINVGSWTIPGVGTEYIYNSVRYISPTLTQHTLDTLTLENRERMIGGKSHVFGILNTYYGDTQYYNIETNGNFSACFAFNPDSVGTTDNPWTTFPTGSKVMINAFTPVDSTDSQGDHFADSDVFRFIATENVSVPGGIFTSIHAREQRVEIQFFPNDTFNSYSIIQSFDAWFVPGMGFYVKELESDTDNGQAMQAADIELSKYSPQ